MTAEQLLKEMCERHGLPATYGDRLLPLVRRAMQAPSDVRERILTLVDQNLARKAECRSPEPWKDMDRAVLMAVAKVLHDWDPSSSVLELGKRLGGLGGPGEAATEM